MHTVRRRLVIWGLTLAGVTALVFGVAAPPEHCPDVTRADLERSATATVDWFERNQDDDGRWLYLYDAEADEAPSDYNVVRHMGVQMSLYQAASASIPGALESADRGLEWSMGELIDIGEGTAVDDGRIAVGSTALLVAGLAERRLVTDDDQYDDVLRRLGTFLASQTETSGAVLAYYDLSANKPVADTYSKYYTGEAYWALTRLHRAFPADGWDSEADRIGGYLATERDSSEGYTLPLPDHWSAYGLSESAQFTDRPADSPLTSDEIDLVRRQAGLFSSQVRWLSQQEGPWGKAVRGTRELRGGGYGVIGEALTGLWQTAQADPRLADIREPLGQRAVCITGIAVSTQVDTDEAQDFADPDRAAGAWFANGETRMDDQQHAMSAVLRTMPILKAAQESEADSAADDNTAEAGSSVPSAWLWLLALAAVINPFRLAATVRTGDRGRTDTMRLTAAGVVAGIALAFAVSWASAPLLDALNITDSAMRVAAGGLAGVVGIVTLIRRPPKFDPALPGVKAAVVPVAIPMVASASLLTAAIGANADRGLLPLAGAAVTALVLTSAAIAAGSSGKLGVSQRVLAWTGRLTSAALVVVAVQLVIDGVLGV